MSRHAGLRSRRGLVLCVQPVCESDRRTVVDKSCVLLQRARRETQGRGRATKIKEAGNGKKKRIAIFPPASMAPARRRKQLFRAAVQVLICAWRLVVLKEIEKRTRRRRRWWVKPWVAQRPVGGATATLLTEWALATPEDYENHLRMSKQRFDDLCNKVRPLIQKQNTRFRAALPAETKLALTLRYLATGDNRATLSALYRVPKNTFSVFFPEVCKAIYDVLADYIKVRTSPLLHNKGQVEFTKYFDKVCVTGCRLRGPTYCFGVATALNAAGSHVLSWTYAGTIPGKIDALRTKPENS